MSKNMKRVSFDDDDDDVQDFIQLQKDTEIARNNLMALKQKKLTLQAEVRFLRQRHKFLLSNKSSTPQEHAFAKPKPTQLRKSNKDQVHFEKQATVRNLPPVNKKKAPRSMPSPEIDMLVGKSVHGVKQQSVQRVIANQRVRVNGPKASSFLDLSKKVDFLGSQTQKPVIDLNRISREEALQEQSEPFNPPMHSLIRNAVEMQHTDVQFDLSRSITGGSSLGGRAGKRKISWQDPVAF